MPISVLFSMGECLFLYVFRTYCKYHYDSEHEFPSPEAEFRHFLVRTGNPNWKWLSKRSVTPPEHVEQCKLLVCRNQHILSNKENERQGHQ